MSYSNMLGIPKLNLGTNRPLQEDWQREYGVGIPTTTWGTVTNVELWSRREADMYRLRGSFKVGTTQGVFAGILLPPGLRVDLNKIQKLGTPIANVGSGVKGYSSTSSFPDRYDLFHDSTYGQQNIIYITTKAGSSVYTKMNANAAADPNDVVIIYDTWIPIEGWDIR